MSESESIWQLEMVVPWAPIVKDTGGFRCPVPLTENGGRIAVDMVLLNDGTPCIAAGTGSKLSLFTKEGDQWREKQVDEAWQPYDHLTDNIMLVRGGPEQAVNIFYGNARKLGDFMYEEIVHARMCSIGGHHTEFWLDKRQNGR